MAKHPAKKNARPGSGQGAVRTYAPHALVLLVSFAVAAALYRPLYSKKCITCPLAAPKLKALPQFSEQYKDEMLWGSYRPGLYMGMRTRAPKSLQFGLMWLDPDAWQRGREPQLRHKASQDDRLQSYGWLQHDGRSYGHQSLIDSPYNISIHMVKQATSGSARGGDWALRISTTAAQGSSSASVGPKQRVSLLLYLWDEDQPATPLTATQLPDKPTHLDDGTVLLQGATKALGAWQLVARQVAGQASSKVPKVRVNYLAAAVTPEQAAVQLEGLTMNALMHNARASNSPKLQLPNMVLPDANLAIVQLTFRLPGTFDVVFLSNPHHEAPSRLQQLTGEPLSALIEQRSREFERRFDEDLLQGRQLDGVARTVSMAALSNLVGGMGYFYGSSRVQLPGEGGQPGKVVEYWPEQLYTAVPSRSFFPRGFLWDEGFHHLLLRRWDPALARDSLAHWLDLLNSYGWIPREQILGDEARARVPADFVNQHPGHANPPSLLLPITRMAATLAAAHKAGSTDGQAAADKELLKAAWPRLEAWYKWYNSTQSGPVPGSFRWHGRDPDAVRQLNPQTLMSGLDDYPRASHPTDDERHLDLLAWMALASQAMATIGQALALPERTVAPYRWAAARLSDEEHLTALHWDEEQEAFADWGLHTEDVRLERVEGQGTEPVRVVGTPPKPQFVPHFGYVSLFPLLMRLLPPSSPRLLQQLDKLSDPALLWTPFGLRSLAPTSSMYMVHNTPHDRPYWRGQIWICLNYLAASSLHYYCGEGVGQACELYGELRENLVGNVAEQYQSTGYLWEQYKDIHGAGQGSHPFTGWTALVALVAAEAY